MTEPKPTVFVVDDDSAVRKSFQWLVESIGMNIEAYSSAREFLEKHDANRPGCLVLDVRMPGMSGIELQETLASKGIQTPIIIVTGYGDVPTAVRAMKKGAVDFIEKPFNDQEMLDRIQIAIEKDAKIRREDSLREQLVERATTLTPREKLVMRRVVAGLSNKEIARDLGISPRTIEVHRAKVMEKMRAGSLAELVRFASLCDLGNQATS